MDDFDFSISKSCCPSSSSSSSFKRRKLQSTTLFNQQRDWSGLPTDIVLGIMLKLTFIDNYVGFGAVCIPWRTVFLQEIPSGRLLYNPSTKRIYNFRLPVPHNKLCRGFSFGWLVTLEGLVNHPDFKMELHNPFLNRTIHLPPPDNILPPRTKNPNTSPWEWDGYDVWRAVLSCDPRHSRTGDSDLPFTDVIFYHKTAQFYALLYNATLLAVDFLGDEGGNPRFTQVPAPPPSFAAFQKYLTEDLSTGDLFMVYKEQCNTVPDEELRFKMFHDMHHIARTGEIPEEEVENLTPAHTNVLPVKKKIATILCFWKAMVRHYEQHRIVVDVNPIVSTTYPINSLIPLKNTVLLTMEYII